MLNLAMRLYLPLLVPKVDRTQCSDSGLYPSHYLNHMNEQRVRTRLVQQFKLTFQLKKHEYLTDLIFWGLL